jgi:hypothetical protein
VQQDPHVVLTGRVEFFLFNHRKAKKRKEKREKNTSCRVIISSSANNRRRSQTVADRVSLLFDLGLLEIMERSAIIVVIIYSRRLDTGEKSLSLSLSSTATNVGNGQW